MRLGPNAGLGLAGVATLAAALAGCRGEADTAIAGLTTAETKQVTAQEIDAAFRDDRDAAASLYAGRVLEVSGVVDGVFTSLRAPAVRLRANQATEPVVAAFGRNETGRLAGLEIGDRVTVVCSNPRPGLGVRMDCSEVRVERG